MKSYLCALCGLVGVVCTHADALAISGKYLAIQEQRQLACVLNTHLG